MSVALIKTLFVLLTEFYYNSQATSAHASCSPQELVIIPYVIGHKTYDITFTVIAMVIEVFIPLTAIAVFHWRVSSSDTRRHTQQQTAHNACILHTCTFMCNDTGRYKFCYYMYLKCSL